MLLLRMAAIGQSSLRLAGLTTSTTSAVTASAPIPTLPFAISWHAIQARATDERLHISKAPGTRPGAFDSDLQIFIFRAAALFQGSSTVDPVVLRASRSRCACCASFRAYFWLTGIFTFPLPTTLNRLLAIESRSSRFAA